MSSLIARLSPPAPVGICILRTADGVNILGNELAHTYLNMLTHEDRQRLTQIICGQQVNFVDVLTSNNTNLQISSSIRAIVMKTWPFVCWWMFLRA